jgi:hypothetical protein
MKQNCETLKSRTVGRKQEMALGPQHVYDYNLRSTDLLASLAMLATSPRRHEEAKSLSG